MITPNNLDEFLKSHRGMERFHFVLAGSVVSGVPLLDQSSVAVEIQFAKVFTGASIVKIESLLIPRENILAWGSGEIEPIAAS